MKPFGIAGIQMNLQHGSNVDAIEERLNVLMSLYPWVEMVVVSELAAHGPLHDFAETMPGVTEERFCAMARRHNIWLIPGSFFELRNEAIFNTAPVINPQGEVIARHRKLFPFCPFEEGVSAGDEFVVFDVPNAGRFGLCICYDMWFPEVLRTLTAKGAEVILHPVLTGTNDREIELNLARSSGALFQSYIIDINGLGVGGVGQSCIIDPSGRVLHQAGETNEYLVTELDFDLVRRQRETGLRSLGQPLKSFRDSKIEFTVYNKSQSENTYLDSLGSLQKPSKENKLLKAVEPSIVMPLASEKSDDNFQTLRATDMPSQACITEPPVLNEPSLSLDNTSAPCQEISSSLPVDTYVENQTIEQEEDVVTDNIDAEITKVAESPLQNNSAENIVESDKELEAESLPDENVKATKADERHWIKDAASQIKHYIKS